MCEYCGCRGNEAIAELMDEHYALLDEGHEVRRALATGDRDGALVHQRRLDAHLDPHVRREEEGIFTALRDADEYVEEVELLEKEHDAFDTAIAGLDPDAADFEQAVSMLLVELDEHVERENLGIFPATVVTLRAEGWEQVARARETHPTFLEPGET
jgi:hypothetical protein